MPINPRTFAVAILLGSAALSAQAQDMPPMPGMDHGAGSGGHDMPAPAKAENATQPKANSEAAGDAMEGMDHGAMRMQGGPAPADARDPHAYSGGEDFGPIPPPRMGDTEWFGMLMIDRLEATRSDHGRSAVYEVQGRFGGDYDRAVFKAEGETDAGRIDEAQNELLWSHAVATYWDTQVGVRHDSGAGPGRSWLAFGVQGLAPYWFELDAAAYVGQNGRTAVRLEAEYELLLTQRLILQPRLEANVYGKRDVERQIGAGLSEVSTGIRLRYEIRREFAPYIGVEWVGSYGATADYARAAGTDPKEARVVAGLRIWY